MGERSPLCNEFNPAVTVSGWGSGGAISTEAGFLVALVEKTLPRGSHKKGRIRVDAAKRKNGGRWQIRTADLLHVKQAL